MVNTVRIVRDSLCVKPDVVYKETVEDLLQRVGGYSWFQVCVTLVLILTEVPSSMISMSLVLIGSDNLEYQCHAANSTEILTFTKDNLCESMSSCVGPIFYKNPTHTSIVQEWSLYCSQRWIVDTITSVQMVGSTIGALLFPLLADKFGRRKILILLCLIMGIFGSASAFAADVITYGALRLIFGLAMGGLFVTYLNYLMEFLTPSCRTICGCVTLWALGEMILALLGYLIPNWRSLTLATSVPSFVVLCLTLWVPESPRWLLCQKKTKEAAEVFSKIAKWNGRPCLTLEEITQVQNNILQTDVSNLPTRQSNCSIVKLTQSSVWKLLSDRVHRRQLLCFVAGWFSISSVYYGLSFNTKNLAGDPYLNLLYLGITELPGPFSGLLFNNRFGRKRTLVGFACASTLCLTLLAIVQALPLNTLSGEISIPTVITALSLAGRYANAAAYAVIACFTAESFPTSARGTSGGLCGVAGNLGGILAPQLVFFGTVWSSGPYVAFCVLSSFVAIICFGLKDTSGKAMHDVLI